MSETLLQATFTAWGVRSAAWVLLVLGKALVLIREFTFPLSLATVGTDYHHLISMGFRI